MTKFSDDPLAVEIRSRRKALGISVEALARETQRNSVSVGTTLIKLLEAGTHTNITRSKQDSLRRALTQLEAEASEKKEREEAK